MNWIKALYKLILIGAFAYSAVNFILSKTTDGFIYYGIVVVLFMLYLILITINGYMRRLFKHLNIPSKDFDEREVIDDNDYSDEEE